MKRSPGGWEIQEEKTYDEFEIFKLIRSRRINPRTQHAVDFVRIEGLDWVNVIALTKDMNLVLVKQYRHGCEQSTIEIPGGCVDPGETDIAQSALRELREESGYILPEKTGSIVNLGSLKPNPALMANTLYLYAAFGVEQHFEQSLDQGEDIEVITKPLKEVLAMIRSGEFSHALHVAAFSLFMLRYPELCRES